MNKETPSDDQKLKLKEELIAKFIAFWIEGNDYLDIMYNKLNSLITEKDDYRFFPLNEILFDALGASYNEGEALISNYLFSGEIKDWIVFFEEIKRHLNGNPSPEDCGLGSYIFESKELVEDSILGLARSLSKGKIVPDVQDKLISILQNFHWKTNDFPKFYLYLVICHGLIGTKKSLPFLRAIIEEPGISSGSFSNDGYGEHSNDHFQDVRSLAIKALIKTSDNNELCYLLNRFKKDCSFKVKKVLYFEIKKFDLPKKLEEELKDYRLYHDLIHVSGTDKEFLLSDFDKVYKQFLL